MYSSRRRGRSARSNGASSASAVRLSRFSLTVYPQSEASCRPPAGSVDLLEERLGRVDVRLPREGVADGLVGLAGPEAHLTDENVPDQRPDVVHLLARRRLRRLLARQERVLRDLALELGHDVAALLRPDPG